MKQANTTKVNPSYIILKSIHLKTYVQNMTTTFFLNTLMEIYTMGTLSFIPIGTDLNRHLF